MYTRDKAGFFEFPERRLLKPLTRENLKFLDPELTEKFYQCLARAVTRLPPITEIYSRLVPGSCEYVNTL